MVKKNPTFFLRLVHIPSVRMWQDMVSLLGTCPCQVVMMAAVLGFYSAAIWDSAHGKCGCKLAISQYQNDSLCTHCTVPEPCQCHSDGGQQSLGLFFPGYQHGGPLVKFSADLCVHLCCWKKNYLPVSGDQMCKDTTLCILVKLFLHALYTNSQKLRSIRENMPSLKATPSQNLLRDV